VLNDRQPIDFSLGEPTLAAALIEHEFDTTALDPVACHDQAEPRMVEQLGERIFSHCVLRPPCGRDLLGDARRAMNTDEKVEAAPAVFNWD
jgi:hypothetical protein